MFLPAYNLVESGRKIRFASVDEIYYKEYMDKFYGPLDAKNGNRITEEKEKYEQMYADISADREQGKSENYIRIKYKEGLNRQAAFDLVTEHVDYLQSSEFLQSRTGGWLFYDEGYAILTDGQNSRNRDVSQAFVYLILLIALTCGIYGVDYANSEKRLLQTTYLGRRELQNKKGCWGFCAHGWHLLSYIWCGFAMYSVPMVPAGCLLRPPAWSICHGFRRI